MSIGPTLVVTEVEGEARVLDTDLAKALGMPNPAQIRVTIKANWAALEQFGVISLVMKKSEDRLGRGRPSTAYWLTEEQALYVTMHCLTDRAEAVKIQIVKVFTAWRRGANSGSANPLAPFMNLENRRVVRITREDGAPMMASFASKRIKLRIGQATVAEGEIALTGWNPAHKE